MQLRTSTLLISTGFLIALPLAYLWYKRSKSKKKDRLDEEQIVRKRSVKIETPFSIPKEDVRSLI